MSQLDDVVFNEEQLFSAHTKLLDSLKREVHSMKDSVLNFKREKIVPQTTYYENISFSDADMKELVGMVRY
jgi:hypothetical protein